MKNINFDLPLTWKRSGEREDVDVWVCTGDESREGGAWRLLVQKEGSPPVQGEVLDCVTLAFRPRNSKRQSDLVLPEYSKLKHVLLVVVGPRTDGIDTKLSDMEELTWHTDKAAGQGQPAKYQGPTSKRSILAPDAIWDALQEAANEEGVSRNELAVRYWVECLGLEDDFPL